MNKLRAFVISILSGIFLVIAFIFDLVGPNGKELVNNFTKLVFGV